MNKSIKQKENELKNLFTPLKTIGYFILAIGLIVFYYLLYAEGNLCNHVLSYSGKTDGLQFFKEMSCYLYLFLTA